MKKGTTGTHYKAEERRRDQVFSLRLTASEMAELRAKADLEGKPLGAWMVETCMHKRVKGYVRPEAAPEHPEQPTAAPTEADEGIPGQTSLADMGFSDARVLRGRSDSGPEDSVDPTGGIANE